MNRLPFLAAVTVFSLVTGCSPEGNEGDGRGLVYQKIADETEWTIRDSGALPECINRHSAGYQFERVDAEAGTSATVRVRREGKELFAYTPSSDDPCYFEDGGVFYYADYRYGTYGCKLVAIDLSTARELWRTELKAIGPVAHSKYRNQVWIEPFDEATVIVFGNEAYGKYIEIVDRKTGYTVGHKVFPPNWDK